MAVCQFILITPDGYLPDDLVRKLSRLSQGVLHPGALFLVVNPVDQTGLLQIPQLFR